MKILIGILAIILLAVLIVPSFAVASPVCPVCGSSVGHLEWQTWKTNGVQHSGFILCCDHCGYTTCRDANGNIASPYFARLAWQDKMFPWLNHGWTHEQYVEWFYK